MGVTFTGVEAVDKLYECNISGNLIPPRWYKEIVSNSNRPNLPAIIILSEILYWYRPKVEQGKTNGEDVKLSKKFSADMLQLSYKQIEIKFNLSRDQCRRALEQLEVMGIVKRHFRTIDLGGGCRLNNVMYIELNADRVIEISRDEDYDPCGINPNRGPDESDELCGIIHIGNQINHRTNTKTTTENSNKDYLSIYQEELGKVKEQIEYEHLIQDRRGEKGVIDEIVNMIAETNLSVKEHQMVGGEPIPTARVKERLKQLDIEVIRTVLDSIRSVNNRICNPRAYMLTALYNAPAIYETDLDMKIRHDMHVNANREGRIKLGNNEKEG